MALKEEFNSYLKTLYNEDEIDEIISYSLVNEGKRLRPLFFFALLLGYNINPKDFFDVAAAIEMIHTYSLIHDDLPAMDNDDYRHGKLSSHKQFGEDNAILAGDALLSDAFAMIVNSLYLDDKTKVILVKELSDAIGSKGMVRGQFYDIKNEKGKNSYHILDAIMIPFRKASDENQTEDVYRQLKEALILHEIDKNYKNI